MRKIYSTLSFLCLSFCLFSQNPQMLKDVFPGNNTGTIQRIVKTTNYTFFNQDDDDADTDQSLFRTDGTTGGTIKLNLTYPGYISTKADQLTALGNKVVFAGDNFTNYGEIWASDGTQAGTVALERFLPNSNRVPVVEINTMGSYAYYSIINKTPDNVNHAYLRRTDGTAAGTSLVYDFSTFTGVPQVVFLTPVNNILYFIVYDQFGTGVDQLWRSDGTTAGTYMVYNFTTTNFVESFIMPVGNVFYIMIGSVVGGIRQNTLWKSDGTAGGTAPLKLIGTGNTNTYPPFATIGTILYFAGVDGNGKELWKTDGTEAGTVRVTDINPGAGNSNPLSLTALNNDLYFSAFDPTNGGELWKYSSGVASLVKDINPGAANSGPGGLVVSNNKIIFNANNGVNGVELWITNGIAANTIMVADVNPGAGPSSPNTFTPGNPVFFAANNGVNGFEVFKYDNNGDVLGGPRKYYVNDNSLTGDLVTLGVGNNNNNGSKAYPFATINYALTQVQAGDSIFVDAGSYIEVVNITKNITIIGAGKGVTILNGPAGLITPFPNTGETGIIQSANGLTDVIIESMTIDGTNSEEQHGIFIQGGGRVSHCELRYVNDGFYFQYINTDARTAIGNNNYVHHVNYVGALFAGNGLSVTASSNVIDLNNSLYGMGFIAGYGGDGNLASFTATNNSIINFNGFGIMVGCLQPAQIHDNSLTRITGNFIQNVHGVYADGLCNWYGTTSANPIIPNITGAVSYIPWLTNGTDNDVAMGFQPLPNVCNGRQNKFYVNDNSQAGDVFTTAVGNDANTGIPSAPLLTLNAALTKAQNGDSIFVDAGTYATPNLNISKSITILGANYNASPNNPADRLAINPARNTNSLITGSTFTISSNDVRLEGLTFNPGARSQVTMATTGVSNFTFKRNYLIVISANILNLNGPSSVPFGQASAFGNYLIEDNRFESQVTVNSLGILIGALNNVTINNNAFFTPATSAQRLLTSCFPGNGGLTVNLIYSNNISNAARNEVFSSSTVASARIENNISLNGQRAFVIQINQATSSDVQIRNNYIESNFADISPIQYRRDGTASTNALASAVIEDNTIFQNPGGRATIQAGITAHQFFTAANSSTTIRRNKISFTGDYSSFTSSNVFGITMLGGLLNLDVLDNEILFNGTNLTTTIPASGPSSSGIYISPDNGPGFSVPANAVLNVTGNKINGFRNSLVVYDASSAVPNTYVGYGNLLPGVILNINNNSLTGGLMAINNGTTGQSANANCNWYGTAAAQSIAAKVTSTVNYTSWLTNGTDSDIPTVGFQPTGACNGSAPVITLNQLTDISCFGANNGAVSISVAGGSTPYIYLWTKDEEPGFTSAAEDQTGLAPGTYHVTVTDANGSITALEVTINEPALLTATPGGTNNLCFGGSNGTATVNAEGGTAPYSYLWSNGETTESISGLVAGIYSVTVTDDNGCTTTTQYEVTQPTQLTATAIGTSTTCANSATVNVSGGTGAYSYLWSNGATTQSITSLLAGTYTVTVTDINGCQTTASCTVTASEAFNPSASVINVSCFGGNNGSITVTNANATAPFQFSLNGVDFVPGTLPHTFIGLTAGTYTIYVRDVNGCTGFVTKTVTQPPLLTATLGAVQSTCFGQSTGSINVTVTGGTGGLTYSWTGPSGYTGTQKNISGLVAGNYHFTVTDANGCTQTLDATVPSFGQINVNATVINIACKGEVNGSVSLNVTGGTGSGFTYAWNTGSTSNAISNLGVANYNVTITDIGSGCVVSRSYAIAQPATNVNISTNKTNATGCNSLGTITASASGGTAPYTYRLNNGSYQPSGSFTGLFAGSYTVTVRDANGCTKTSAAIGITDNGSDEFEGNNSKNQAKQVALSVTNSARNATTADSTDWFKFTTTSAGSYTLTLTHPSAIFRFSMFPAGNNTPALISSSATTTTKVYLLAANTTYYISITGGLSYICYQFSVAPTSFLTRSSGNNVQQEAIEDKSKNVFDATGYPNPSNSYFNVKVRDGSDETINLRVMDASGRLIEERKNVASSQIVRLGDRYINGVYVVEIIQGNNRKTLRLVKM